MWIKVISAVIGLCLIPILAWGQGYPSRQITIVTPYAPGGGADAISRLLADHLRSTTGQTVIVENRPGGGALIGAAAVAKAAPDGYTLLVTGPSITTASVLFKKPIIQAHELAAISQITISPYLIAARADLPTKDCREFFDYARKNPGLLKYGSVAANNVLLVELFKRTAGINLLHIPYTGSVPANTALLRGDVDVVFDGMITLRPTLESGKAKLIAVASAQRSSLYPDLPSMLDCGVKDYDVGFWFGLMAPAGTPADIKDGLVGFVRDFLKTPLAQQRIAAFGYAGVGSGPAEFQRIVDTETKLWNDIAAVSGIEPQ